MLFKLHIAPLVHRKYLIAKAFVLYRQVTGHSGSNLCISCINSVIAVVGIGNRLPGQRSVLNCHTLGFHRGRLYLIVGSKESDAVWL